MSTAALAVVPQHEEYSREKIDLIKRTICAGASDDELSLFLYTAKRTGLDPLARQIHMVKRWNSAAGREVAAIQTGIDGYRLIADRTGKLAGISDVEYDDESGDRPGKATVTVKKIVGGAVQEFTASARWTEYVQTKKDGTPVSMWLKMPFLMLGKCAEALALRKAFPADLSGVYTFEEMGQADNPEPQGDGKSLQAHVEQGGGKKTPVNQPQRASEVVVEEITGSISGAKFGGKGSLWMHIGDKLVVVEADNVSEGMVDGNILTAKAKKQKNERIGEFWGVKEVLGLEIVQVEDGDVIEGDVEDEADSEQEPIETKPTGDPKLAEGLKDVFASGALKTGRQVAEETNEKKEKAWRAHVGHDPVKHISHKQGGLLFTIAGGRQLKDADVKAFLKEEFGVEHRYLITKEQFPAILDGMDPNFEYHEKKG